jgi:ParB family chromosome partitioning protein
VESTQNEFQMIPLSALHESPWNLRMHFDDRKMKELVDSIGRIGVLTPLIARPNKDGYEIAAGHRRFRAAKQAGMTEVPVRVRAMNDTEFLEILTIENLQREDLHPLDEAQGYQALMEKAGYDVPAIAAKVNKSESFVYQRLKLAELIPPAKKAFFEERITAGHAILIARLQPKDQKEALEACFDGYRRDEHGNAWLNGVRDLSHWIRQQIHLDLHAAPFSKTESDYTGEKLPRGLESAGACMTCPKRTGFLPQLFPDITQKDICTDPTCYNLKIQAHIIRKKHEIEAAGEKLIQVTSDDSYNMRRKEQKNLLPRDKYTVIEKKQERCDKVEKAIVVAGNRDRGRVIDICQDPKCKKHHGGFSYHRSPQELARQKAEEQKRKRESEIRLRIQDQILGKVYAHLDREDSHFILRAHIMEMQNDLIRPIVKRHGWELKKNTYQDWRAAAADKVRSLTTEEERRLAMEISLANLVHIGNWCRLDRPKELLEIASRYKVDVKEIEKAVDFELAEKKAKKAASAKPKKQPAPAKTAAVGCKSGDRAATSKRMKKYWENWRKSQKVGAARKETDTSGSGDGAAAFAEEHACEKCNCTESHACPGGCSWSPAFLKIKRYVCSSCEASVMDSDNEVLAQQQPLCKFCLCGPDVRPLVSIKEGKICTDCKAKGAHRVARAKEKSA